MKKILRFCVILIICGAIYSFSSPNPENFLIRSKTVYSEITPHKPDTFYVQMRAKEFASIRITEKNVRINARVFDPQNRLIQYMDQNQKGDKEVVSIFSEESGIYKVIVAWNFNEPLTGKYTITLDKLERAGNNAVEKSKQLFDGWYEKDAPGAALLVIKNGMVALKLTKGLANLEDNIPIRTNSLFELASCSKQFTGYAIAMLVDQGKISLEDDIRKYLPEMPDYSTPITIANLVYHTSGIRNTDDLQFAGFGPQDITTLPICLNFAFAQKHLIFKPGERYNYSNTNYNLLAEIVTRVTGIPFPAWCKVNIFQPYGMTNTWFKTDIGQVVEHGIHCYSGTKDGFIELKNNWAATGASGLQTSLDDLEKWMIDKESNEYMNSRIYRLLNTTTTLSDGSSNNYVFGNEIKKDDKKTEIVHLGLVLGIRTAIVRYPEEKLSIIYLSNDGNDATFQRIWKIRDIFLRTNTENLPDPKKIPKVEDALERIENEKGYKESLDVNPYIGTYFSEELSTVWTLKNENGQLIIHHPRLNPIKLKSSGLDQFGFLQFVRDDSNNVIGLRILGNGIVFDKKLVGF